MRIKNINEKPRIILISLFNIDLGLRHISFFLKPISIIMTKIERVLDEIVLIILYEKGQERLRLILQYIVYLALSFLRTIQSALGIKTGEKLDHYLQSFNVNLLRRPVFMLNNSDKILRVCLTYRCNTSCEFCYAKGLLEKFPKDMSLGDFAYLTKWAKAQGWKKIFFLGGEPTVHPQFEEILDTCYREQIIVHLSTNGLFGKELLKKFKSSYVWHITFSYHPYDQASSSLRKQFLYNLEYLKRERIFLSLSGALDGKDDKWKEMIETAAKLNLPIRWSLLLLGYTRNVASCGVLSNLNLIGSQLFEVLKTCADKKVVCYVYRTVPACVFTPEQWQRIRKIYRYIAYSRCPVGFKRNYSCGVTVNPDLSTFACSVFFIKGPHIASFKDRIALNQYYEKVAKDTITIPPMKECNNCRLYQNFLSSITTSKSKIRLCDKNVCQAGCFNFRKITCSTLFNSVC